MTDDDSDTPPADPGPPPPGRSVGGSAPTAPAPWGAPAPIAEAHDEVNGPEVPGAKAPKRRTWPWVLVIVVVVALFVASRINLDYYAIQPGTAQSVQPFITVPPGKAHPVSHPVLLTDVEIGRVSALSYLFYKVQGNTTLEPVEAVTGGTPPSQLDAQGQLEMSQAESYAKTAALRQLGYTVTATAAGAVVYGTFPGTPAYHALAVGDVVTAVDGVATPTALDLTSTLRQYHSGQTVTLAVRKGGTGGPTPVPLTLKSTVVDLGGGYKAALDVGLLPEDQVDYAYPFPVTIDVTNIGGPSAGLAMTLGVIDALTAGSLTGGHTVAATGTIDSSGKVGDVGGVPQKTIAVENAGASIFLVPPQEYRAAVSKDRPGLRIYAVSTLDQALAVLAAHGGTVSTPAPGQQVALAG
ncbi:MAG TPA: S16 family serine protease [Acidimicrobiales bacterium]|nr:S16 family serine protease [Acidimicrobiales bacterium]